MRVSASAWLTGLLVWVSLASGCSEDDAAKCSADGDCARGQICEEAACTALACTSVSGCPGSGRTCLYDLDTCSAKECNGAINGEEVFCAEPLSQCVRSGRWGSACIEPGTFECAVTEECGDLGEGFECCGGVCQAECGAGGGGGGGAGGGLPVDDMGGLPTEDLGAPVDDMGPPPADMGPPAGDARLCSACTNDADCATLGEGAQCTPIGGAGAFCTSACDPAGSDCPAGYQCVQGFDQCLPLLFECVGCLAQDCAAGEVCDVYTGECKQPQGVCGTCTDDTGCVDGLTCGPFAGFDYCLAPCADGACDAGYACTDGLCTPTSGACDACGGNCGGDTPFCAADSGQCAQCGPGSPCPDGLSCDLNTNNCTDVGPACQSDIDCQAPGQTVCFNGACVACFDDSQCPARHACNENFQCVESPCAGVTCQRPAVCNPATGACDPGCQTAMDCAVPEEMSCNAQTGQCYYDDYSCDLAAAESVCAPGGLCQPGFPISLERPERGYCSCVLSDPANPLSAPIIGCQPGATCFYFALPGTPPPESGNCVAPLF